MHAEHTERPGVAAMVPARQALQTVAPDATEIVPAAQFTHEPTVDDPVTLEYVPAAQVVQTD